MLRPEVHASVNSARSIRVQSRARWRVLRKGGKCCALGEVAGGPLFQRILTSRIGPTGRRARSLEIEEKVSSLRTWKHDFESCGFSDIRIHFDKTWEHKLYNWFTALYYSASITKSQHLHRRFPVVQWRFVLRGSPHVCSEND
jgi:hypothetical protein